jgi:hypothetical protein
VHTCTATCLPFSVNVRKKGKVNKYREKGNKRQKRKMQNSKGRKEKNENDFPEKGIALKKEK